MVNIYFNSELFINDLKNYRKSKTQSELAKELDINRTTLSHLENGKQLPSLGVIQRFCSLNGVNVQKYFVEDKQDSIMLLMGRLVDEDKPKLRDVMKRINIRLKYIELAKRCDN